MTLFGYELKKTARSWVAWAALMAAMALTVMTVLMGDPGTSYSREFPASAEKLREIREERAYFAGPVTPEWTARYRGEDEAILAAPEYRVSDEEAENIVRQYTERYGYTEEAVRGMTVLFLNEAGLAAHMRYEDPLVAGSFYENAERYGESMAEYYLRTYPGEKGTRLAESTRESYSALATEYTARYNYDLGYEKVRSVMNSYPYTVGTIILIAMVPVFSGEYRRKTASLLKSSRYGRGRLGHIKLASGLTVAVAVWTIVTVVTLTAVFSIYGATGGEALWQDWVTAVSPFPWDQLKITAMSLGTSLLGAVYLALAVMLVSSAVRSQLTGLAAGGAILLFPMLDFVFDGVPEVSMLYDFLPSRLLMGDRIWRGFELFYLFGHPVPYQYVALSTAAVLCIAMWFLTAGIYNANN